MTLRMTHSCGEVNQVSWLLVVVYCTFYILSVTVAHKIYGVPQTINSANYVFFLAYEKLFALRNHATASPSKEVEGMVTGMSIVLFI